MAWYPHSHRDGNILRFIQHTAGPEAPLGWRNSLDSTHCWILCYCRPIGGLIAHQGHGKRRLLHLQQWQLRYIGRSTLVEYCSGLFGEYYWPDCCLTRQRCGYPHERRATRCFLHTPKSNDCHWNLQWNPRLRHASRILLLSWRYFRSSEHSCCADRISIHPGLRQRDKISRWSNSHDLDSHRIIYILLYYQYRNGISTTLRICARPRIAFFKVLRACMFFHFSKLVCTSLTRSIGSHRLGHSSQLRSSDNVGIRLPLPYQHRLSHCIQ